MSSNGGSYVISEHIITIRDRRSPTVPKHQVTISPTTNGAISVMSGGTSLYNGKAGVTLEVEQGTQLSVQALPDAGYRFLNWSGSLWGASNPASLVVSSAATIGAAFELIPPASFTVQLSASPEAGGTVSGAGSYQENSQVTVTATANSGYKFVKWTENGAQVSTSASYQFQITSNRNLVAVFEKLPVVITPPTNFEAKAYQRDAIISWTAGGNEKEWEVTYGDYKITVTQPKAILRGLTPGSENTVQIRAKVGDKLSEPLIGKFTTEALTATANRIPHLYGMKDAFKVGEILPVFWKDLEKLPTSITYNLSAASASENSTKIFAPLPETIQFTSKGLYMLTIRFEGHEMEEITCEIEVKGE